MSVNKNRCSNLSLPVQNQSEGEYVKVKFTRADFLSRFFTNFVSMDDLETLLESAPYTYGAYTLLKPFGLEPSDVISVALDSECRTITIHMANEKLAKRIKKEHTGVYKMTGDVEHHATCSVNGKFVTFVFTD